MLPDVLVCPNCWTHVPLRPTAALWSGDTFVCPECSAWLELEIKVKED